MTSHGICITIICMIMTKIYIYIYAYVYTHTYAYIYYDHYFHVLGLPEVPRDQEQLGRPCKGQARRSPGEGSGDVKTWWE